MSATTIDLGRVVGEQWFLHAKGSSQTTVPTGEITQLSLSERTVYNGGNMALSSDGGVKVSAAGVYKVTADLYMSAASERKGVYVYKGTSFSESTEVCGVYADISIACHVQCVGVVEAAANDVFYVAGRAYGSAGNAGTRWLLVERIK